MSVRGNIENCVEEPVAPEWLSKLERRRENMQRATKLSHEVGAGAPCGECGEKCPGLDLHFWRKVCRNCKCRKDQHKCSDGDLSTWAQFEILGQICSKPAYIKIKALASQPVELEWVPPNTTPDVVSEYMEKLGTSKMPITGSEAAQKRKQQLEFQVPPHDLNAELCDNLTDAEANQLQQYVIKIRDNCVGQGIVVRIGNVGIGFVDYIPSQELPSVEAFNSSSANVSNINSSVGEYSGLSFHSPLPLKAPISSRFGTRIHQDTPVRKLKFDTVVNTADVCNLPSNIDYEKDPVFGEILRSEQLNLVINSIYNQFPPAKEVIISGTKMPLDCSNITYLSSTAKGKLNEFEIGLMATQSALLNGCYYDVLFATLNDNNVEFGKCKLLSPIQKLRKELQVNQPLSDELQNFVAQLPSSSAIIYTVPIKSHLKKSNSIDSGFGSKASTPNCNMTLGFPSNFDGALKTLPSALQQLKIAGNNPRDVQAAKVAIKCRDCNKSIFVGDVAVRAERAGKEIAWHPECFKCFTCRELLADLVYFFHGGQVYCGRDLAINLKIPRCKACDELIFTKEYTAAEGATFHIKHFCCYYCDIPLAGHQYIPDEKTNMPLCLTCFNHYFAATCQRCDRSIEPTDQGVAWGSVHWHSACFICAGVNCEKSLIGGRFCVKENMPFCSPTCVRSII